MSDYIYVSLQLAGVQLDCRLRFPDTLNYLRKYIVQDHVSTDHPVFVSDLAFRDWEKLGNRLDGFAEFCLLCQPISEALMSTNRFIFHAVALRVSDQAILLCGGSGVGKSTHSRMLLEKHPEEFSVINGDKPILEFRDGSFIVHPSPWNGKEGYHGAPSAPLREMYFLRRGPTDSLEICPKKVAVIHAFPLVFQSYSNEKIIRESARVTDLLLNNTPSYLFSSNDLVVSSDLLYHTIREAKGNDL